MWAADRSSRRWLAAAVGLSLPAAAIFIVSTVFFPLSGARISLLEGQTTFGKRCASCHMLEASAGGGIGPNLNGIGREAGGRRPGMSAAEYLLEAIVDPAAFEAPGAEGQMPANSAAGLGRAELLNLVAFLSSLGSRPDYRGILALETPEVVGGTQGPAIVDLSRVERGWKLFFDEAECNSCHSIYPEPGNGLRAPALTQAGQHSEAYLRESIEDPGAVITPGYEAIRARTPEGVRTGRILRRSGSVLELLLTRADGSVKPLTLSVPGPGAEAVVETERQSSMPVFPLEPEDLDALVEFLKTLGG